MPKGSVQVNTLTINGTTGTTGAYILTERHGITCLGGVSAGVSGVTGYEVPVTKMAWGNTGEYYWIDSTVAEISGGGGSCGRGPLPVQLITDGGAAISSTAISSSTKRMVDVNILNQGGSAASLLIYGPGATATIAVAGTSGGHYVPIAGSTAGGAIPHVGATTDASVTGGYGTSAQALAVTGGFAGTVSAKLRRIASDIHSIKVGGTGADGTYRIGGLSADIRSVIGWTGDVGGPSVLIKATGGMTAAISAIAGGITIGIASVAVDNPAVIGSNTAITGGTGGGSGWGGTQLSTTSTTLKSGVRIKNTQGSTTLTVSYDSSAGTTTGMTSGWDLDDREEVFIEVDNINKIFVRSSGSATAYSYYAT
jgi:hypothetical protein